MQPTHRFILLAGVLAITLAVVACAAPITYPVRITYTGQTPLATERSGQVGLQILSPHLGEAKLLRIAKSAEGVAL